MKRIASAVFACSLLLNGSPPALAQSCKEASKPLDDLVKRLGGPGAAERLAAAEALARLGPEARDATLPLLRATRDRNLEVMVSASRALLKIGPPAVPALAAALRDPELTVSAASVLGQLGAEAKPAAPALVEALRQPQRQRPGPGAPPPPVGVERETIVTALVKIGEPAVPALVEAGRDFDPPQRVQVVRALAEIGPGAAEAVPALLEWLDDKDPTLRWQAVFALGKVGPAAAKAVPKLMEVLRDPKRPERGEAPVSLGKIGDAALPSLVEGLKDKDVMVRQACITGLTVMGPDAKEAAPALAEALATPALQYWAAKALERIGPPAKEAVPPLINVVKDRNSQGRTPAILALAAIGPDAKEAAPVLVALLGEPQDFRDPGYNERSDACMKALARIGEPAVPGLLDLLKRKDNRRYLAVRVLTQLGPAARDAAPALVALLAEEPSGGSRLVVEPPEQPVVNGYTVSQAAKALLAIGPAAVPPLSEALGNEKYPRRDLAAALVGLLGADAKPAVPALLALVKKGSLPEKAEAVKALGRIKSDDAEVMPALLALMKEKDDRIAKFNPEMEVGVRAGVAVGRIDGGRLAECLRDENANVRYHAARALQSLGRDGKDALPALLAALKDGDAEVRRQAALAVAKVTVAAGVEPQESVKGLAALVGDDDVQVRSTAAYALEQMGPRAREAAPALLESLRGTTGLHRRAIVKALPAVGADPKAFVPVLAEAGREDDLFLRRAVAQSLAAAGPAAKEATPVLVEYLKQKDPYLREDAVKVVAAIGPGAKDAVPALAALLKEDARDAARGEVAEALGRIGPDAGEAVPALLEVARNKGLDYSARIKVQNALRLIDPDSLKKLSANP